MIECVLEPRLQESVYIFYLTLEKLILFQMFPEQVIEHEVYLVVNDTHQTMVLGGLKR